MKLVKITEDLYLNSDFIESVEADGEESVIITMTSGAIFSPNVSIKKVLDTICGSEEHLNDNSQQYNISITTGDSGSNFSGTMADVLKTLKELSEKEMLMIRR